MVTFEGPCQQQSVSRKAMATLCVAGNVFWRMPPAAVSKPKGNGDTDDEVMSYLPSASSSSQ